MKSLKAMIPVATLLAALFTGTAALAHSDEYLDTQKAPNGGQLRMAGVYHFELIVTKDSKEAKDNPVVVYVTDHAGIKVSTVGASGTVTILAGKAKATVPLAPDGENRMKGIGKYASIPDMKAIVAITLAGKAAEQARFTPLAVSAQTPSLTAKDDHSAHNH